MFNRTTSISVLRGIFLYSPTNAEYTHSQQRRTRETRTSTEQQQKRYEEESETDTDSDDEKNDSQEQEEEQEEHEVDHDGDDDDRDRWNHHSIDDYDGGIETLDDERQSNGYVQHGEEEQEERP